MRLLAASPGSLPAPGAATFPDRGVDRALEQVIDEQVRCGLDTITDGQLGWADPVSHLAARLTGVELAEPVSFLDTPIEVRPPRIRGPFAWAVPVARPEFERARARSTKPVKPVLTGALTLARHAVVLDPHYRGDWAGLAMAFNEALVCEVRELAAAGATLIQIDEPVILREQGAWRLLKSCLRRLASAKGAARLVLNIGWGDPAPMLDELLSAPADILALDLTRNPRLAAVLAHAELRKPLQLGIVDGWADSIEDAGALAAGLEEFVARSTVPECHLSVATGLRGMSTETARAKLQVLAQVRDMLAGAARSGAGA